jgi:hypothetical protein
MKSILFLLTALLSFSSFSQKNVFLRIVPKVGGVEFQMFQNLTDLSGVVFELDHFDYYLSSVKITHDGGQILTLPQEVYLIEPNNYTIYLGYLNVTDIESIEFGVGVPENLNTINGADAIDIVSYPVGHPLSFQEPSMHWGWSSGYMHMIVGGLADSNNDGDPDKIFQIHSLGNNTYATVTLPVIESNSYPDQIDINLNCNLDIWLTGADLKTVDIAHGTSGINYTVMHNAEILGVFDQSMNASTTVINASAGKVWFFNHSNAMEIFWEGIKDLAGYELIDVQGRIVESGSETAIKGSRTIDVAQGAYQLRFFDSNGLELKKINVVR